MQQRVVARQFAGYAQAPAPAAGAPLRSESVGNRWICFAERRQSCGSSSGEDAVLIDGLQSYVVPKPTRSSCPGNGGRGIRFWRRRIIPLPQFLCRNALQDRHSCILILPAKQTNPARERQQNEHASDDDAFGLRSPRFTGACLSFRRAACESDGPFWFPRRPSRLP